MPRLGHEMHIEKESLKACFETAVRPMLCKSFLHIGLRNIISQAAFDRTRGLFGFPEAASQDIAGRLNAFNSTSSHNFQDSGKSRRLPNKKTLTRDADRASLAEDTEGRPRAGSLISEVM